MGQRADLVVYGASVVEHDPRTWFDAKAVVVVIDGAIVLETTSTTSTITAPATKR